MLWTSCSHKKAVIAGTCLMAWNLSSVSARLFGAFFMIVALRLYQQTHNPSFGSHSVNEDANIATLALICNTVTDQFTKDIQAAHVSPHVEQRKNPPCKELPLNSLIQSIGRAQKRP
jgi:hypothetical protein